MILANGVYISDSEVYEGEDSAVLAAVIRSRRNRLLQESDKYMLPDYPLTDEQRSILIEYRAKLRAIPQADGFPFDVVFPEVEIK